MQAEPARKIVATEAALAALRRLRAEHGPLMLFQSGGCCDGSSPIFVFDVAAGAAVTDAYVRFPFTGWPGWGGPMR